MIQAKNIVSREDNFSPDEFKEKVNNYKKIAVMWITAIFVFCVSKRTSP